MNHIKDILIQRNNKQPYLKYAKNTYTQNGDEGVLFRLLEELNIKNGVVVEFGAWDGIWISNTYPLRKSGHFEAILIEGDKNKYRDLINLTENCDNVESLNYFIDKHSSDENSLDNVLAKSRYKITKDNYAVLSIDIDSYDYSVFESIEIYRPKIIIIETNCDKKVDELYAGPHGSSLKSLYILSLNKGYTLVCSTGNAFFVRDDLVSMLKEHDSSLSHDEYYVSVNLVDEVLQKLDENGYVREYGNIPRYLSDEYKELILKEKSKYTE